MTTHSELNFGAEGISGLGYIKRIDPQLVKSVESMELRRFTPSEDGVPALLVHKSGKKWWFVLCSVIVLLLPS